MQMFVDMYHVSCHVRRVSKRVVILSYTLIKEKDLDSYRRALAVIVLFSGRFTASIFTQASIVNA